MRSKLVVKATGKKIETTIFSKITVIYPKPIDQKKLHKIMDAISDSKTIIHWGHSIVSREESCTEIISGRFCIATRGTKVSLGLNEVKKIIRRCIK
jgi:hypothetical protein